MNADSHYDVQLERRAKFLDDWRRHRQTVISSKQLSTDGLAAPQDGYEESTFLGTDAGRPTRFLDAKRQRLANGVSTKMQGHSWDVVSFVVAGRGETRIGDDTYSWRVWDAIHLPSGLPYSHAALTDVELISFSSYPMFRSLNATWHWQGQSPRLFTRSSAEVGRSQTKNRARELRIDQAARESARRHTDYDELELVPNRKGTRSKFLVDPSLGYQTSGLTAVMTQYAPGGGQAMHCHPGEAFLYVVEGEGESYIGGEPKGGRWYPWRTGDLIVVDHFVWHQHWNRNTSKTARLLRVHMHESILSSMQAVMDPIQLIIEPEEQLRKMPDADKVEWPPDVRPDK